MKESINELILKDYINLMFMSGKENINKSYWNYIIQVKRIEIIKCSLIISLIWITCTCIMTLINNFFGFALIEILLCFGFISHVASLHSLKNILNARYIINLEYKCKSILFVLGLTVFINIIIFIFLPIAFNWILLLSFLILMLILIVILLFMKRKQIERSKKRNDEHQTIYQYTFDKILEENGFDLKDTYLKTELSSYLKENAKKNVFMRTDNKKIIILKTLFISILTYIAVPRISDYMNDFLNDIFPSGINGMDIIITIIILLGFIVVILKIAFPAIIIIWEYYDKIDLIQVACVEAKKEFDTLFVSKKNKKKKKTILMDARAMGLRPSGIGMYIYNLVKELSIHEDLSFTLITDVSESEEMKEMKQKVSVLEYGKPVSKNLSLFGYYRFVQKCINEVKPDIFWEGNNLVPIRIRNPYGRLFATIYDMFPLSDPEHYGKIYSNYFRYGIENTIKYFDTFIYDSYDCKKNTEKYFPEIKTKNTFVGYVIVPELPAIETSDNGDFLYIGNLETRKGTDILLKAYKLYKQNGGTRGLRIAGKMREERIQKLFDEITAEIDGITYLGYISEEQRNQEYAACHAFLFPSRAEGFGIPIIEAMNYNKPVIAGKLDTLVEVAGNEINYFPLLQDTEKCAAILAEKMKEDQTTVNIPAYREVVKRYTSEEVGRKYYEWISDQRRV